MWEGSTGEERGGSAIWSLTEMGIKTSPYQNGDPQIGLGIVQSLTHSDSGFIPIWGPTYTPAGRLWLVMRVWSFVVFTIIECAVNAMGLSDMKSGYLTTHTNTNIINSCSFMQPNVVLGILRTSTSSVNFVARRQGWTWLEKVWIQMSIAMVTTASTV